MTTIVTPELVRALRERAPRITVIGDLILDGWWSGRTERMSREAPAPVVEILERTYAPGGAANTAVNLAALGAQVRVAGVVGADDPGRRLGELLSSSGVDAASLVQSAAIATVTKYRVVCGDQILLRIDDVQRPEPTPELLAELQAAVEAAVVGADAVVVCDYGAGLLQRVVGAALAAAGRSPLLVVDAHDPRPWAALRPDLVTPNAAETFQLLGRAEPSARRAEAVKAAAAELLQRTGAAAVVVTLDRDGTALVEADALGGPRVTHRTRAEPGHDQQAAGAGDTFVAALTLARAAGLPLPICAEVGQLAADVVVHRPGTAVCGTEDLIDHLERGELVVDEETLVRRVAAARAAGRRIVVTNGCFDVLHRGHTGYLRQAAELGDLLVVAVNSDASVRRLKGPERPVNPASDRAGLLAALSCVDYVTVFDTDTPIPLLERLRPDVYAKGGDYTPEMLAESTVVEAYGGTVQIVDYVPSQSTTSLVARIRATAPGATP